MSDILLPVLIVSAIGVSVGLLLSAVWAIMTVPKDETAQNLTEALPSAECGACEAILDTDIGDVAAKAAIVRCLGICDNTYVKMDYTGFNSCAAAAQLYGGMNACRFGCIGLGDCARECDHHAIELCNEIAIVDRDICVGCGKCAEVCPKQLIELTDRRQAAQVMCSNREKGAVTRKNCRVGCIGCMRCERVCPEGAVKVENFLARVDRSLCTGCGICIMECPTGSIHEII